MVVMSAVYAVECTVRSRRACIEADVMSYSLLRCTVQLVHCQGTC